MRLLFVLLFFLCGVGDALAINYTTAQGVQQFSITIPSSASTGTATINSVGSGAFILYGGFNPNTSANPQQDYAYLQLTNSTTVTATRSGSAVSDTVVLTGCILDGDTTNLIKSIQQGTIAVGSGASSNTATINPVTNANVAVHYLGQLTTDASLALDSILARLSLSGTTLTATKATTGAAVTVAYEIIEFQGTVLTANAVQQVSAASSSGVTSFTASLGSNVVLNNALSIYGGSTIATVTVNEAQGLMRGALTGVGTFTVNVNTTDAVAKNYNASIVEFNSGVLNSAVQRSNTTLTGVPSNTTAVSPSVNFSYAGLSWLNNTATATTSLLDQSYGAGALTNGSTITVTKNTATANITSSQEVFEFSAFVPPGGTAEQDAIWFGSFF